MKRLLIIIACGAMCFCLGLNQAFAAEVALSSEAIATRAEAVARATRTTGYCYAAVSKALNPLGVALHGSAAYQARDLLLKDERFVPLAVNHVDHLHRGDIIVYTKSGSHPYGHISVYQGNYEEASDHISAVTHTQAYGGATVFRLRNELASRPYSPPPHTIARQPKLATNRFRPAWQAVRKHYYAATGRSLERVLLRRCVGLLWR